MIFSNCRILLLIVFFCLSYQTAAVENTIEDIELRNIQRINPDIVFANLLVNIGETFDNKRLAAALKKLFATDYFDDLRLEREGNTLVIVVDERPTVRTLTIEGDSKIPETSLRDDLARNLIAEGEVLRRDALNGIIKSIERSYNLQGQYGTKIEAVTEKSGNKLVDVIINIEESPKALISKINIIGNHTFDDNQLLEELELEQSSTWNAFWSWANDANSYAREKLEGDLGRLRSFYFERGYIDFAVQSTNVSISRNRSNLYISIAILEGQQYTVRNIEFWGDLIIPEDEYRNMMQLQSGSIYVDSLVTSSKIAMESLLGNRGYGFAEIALNLVRDEASNEVDIQFFVKPGNRTYVRQITFVGNQKTADYVLRRELRQYEGGWYSNEKIRISTSRINRLGYIVSATHKVIPVPNKPNQVDIEYTIVERSSGQFTGGIFYSQLQGLGIDVSTKDSNLLGSGDTVSFTLRKARRSQLINFSMVKPYITPDAVTLNGGILLHEQDYTGTEIENFRVSTQSTNIGFAYPIAESIRLSYELTASRRNITVGKNPVLEMQQFTNDYGTMIDSLNVSSGLSYSSLNRGIFPTRGFSNFASIGLDFKIDKTPAFYKLSYNYKFFYPIDAFEKWVYRLSSRLNYAKTLSDESVPFLFNYYAGGYGTVRGYTGGSLGPRTTKNDGSVGGSLGGNILVQTTQELIFPLWFQSDSVRISFFHDVGNVFTSSCVSSVEWCQEGVDLSRLRSSYGFTLVWYTVVGPFVFIMPRAVNPGKYDTTQSFQISLGRLY